LLTLRLLALHLGIAVAANLRRGTVAVQRPVAALRRLLRTRSGIALALNLLALHLRLLRALRLRTLATLAAATAVVTAAVAAPIAAIAVAALCQLLAFARLREHRRNRGEHRRGDQQSSDQSLHRLSPNTGPMVGGQPAGKMNRKLPATR
jgi:hypothetical protein